MTAAEILAYIDESPRTGHLATVREDGRPHVAPIWIIRDGDQIVFTTWHTSVKGRNLVRTGQAALTADDLADGGSFLTLEGAVAISDDLAELRTCAARLGGKYMGEDKAESFGARNGVEGELLCRLIPTHMTRIRDITG